MPCLRENGNPLRPRLMTSVAALALAGVIVALPLSLSDPLTGDLSVRAWADDDGGDDHDGGGSDDHDSGGSDDHGDDDHDSGDSGSDDHDGGGDANDAAGKQVTAQLLYSVANLDVDRCRAGIEPNGSCLFPAVP